MISLKNTRFAVALLAATGIATSSFAFAADSEKDLESRVMKTATANATAKPVDAAQAKKSKPNKGAPNAVSGAKTSSKLAVKKTPETSKKEEDKRRKKHPHKRR